MEAEFVQGRAPELASALFVGGGMIFAFSSFVLAGLMGAQAPQGNGVAGFTLASSLLMRRQMIVGTMAACGVLAMMVAKAPRILDSIRPADCEMSVVCAVVAITIVACLVDPYYMAKMHGLDPYTVFAAGIPDGDLLFADTRVLLYVDGIITVSHLLLPVRWCVLWPVDCAGVLSYAAMISLIGSPEKGRAAGNLGLLIALCLSMLMGKRRIECHERLAFGNLCPETSSEGSFEEEMPLSDLSTSGHNETGAVTSLEDDQYSVPSVPTTTHTGRMFAELERVDSEVRWKLEKIAGIGHNERWLIEASHVRLMPNCILGSGSFGVVVLASLHGSKVAVKVPRSSVNGSTAWHLPSLGNELRILRHVRHPNVVLFHGACIDPTSSELALVLEHVQGRRLDRFLDDSQAQSPDISDSARHCILIDICCALRYLHGQRPCVVHGDLKASNILVEDWHVRPKPKLVDFGLSRLLTRKAKPLGGTLNWMAPELLQNPNMSPAPSADVFSFGRLAYFVTTGVRPLAEIDRRALVKLARKLQIPSLVWPQDAPFSLECQALIHKCLEVDQSLRPHMVEVHHDLVRWTQPEHVAELLGQGGASGASSSGSSTGPIVPAAGGLGTAFLDVPDGDAQDSSLSWRSGLRMVRESLRPVPPNRPGHAPTSPSAPTCGPDSTSRWSSSDAPATTVEHAGVSAAAAAAAAVAAAASSNSSLRWQRPLPPPRPQVSQAFRTRSALPKLPKLPPVLEGDFESTPKHESPVPDSVQPIRAAPLDAADADAECDSAGAAEDAAATVAARLVLSQFCETPVSMMEMSVIDAFQRWNFKCNPGTCCLWHGALQRLREVTRGLRSQACNRDFQIVRDWQCPRCFLMDQLDEDVEAREKACDLCGYDPVEHSNLDEEDDEQKDSP